MNIKNLWKPYISLDVLRKRAKILSKIRGFFSKLNVLEVETPILSHYSVTDVNFVPFSTCLEIYKKKMWLVPSPEYHMKRLLVLQSGPIYQICKSFRNNELGSDYHNPEFTILEWYQPYCNMFNFIKKVESLLGLFINFKDIVRMSYQQVFIKYINIDPLSIRRKDIIQVIKNYNLFHLVSDTDSVSTLLELLFVFQIESNFNKENITIIYHYPADQAALAAINSEDNRVADRFEIFFQGVELGNGFYELTDSLEQKKRFAFDNVKRKTLCQSMVKIDKWFIEALSRGLPPCSGIAIGLDRLVMLSLNLKTIKEVMTFPIDRC